jgi:hypothetical protein
MTALASCSLLLSCSEPEASDATHWRISVGGSPSCLAELTQKMTDARVDVARFPQWNGGYGVIEFGPVPRGRTEDLFAIVRNSGCAEVKEKRASCSSDYSDVHAC